MDREYLIPRPFAHAARDLPVEEARLTPEVILLLVLPALLLEATIHIGVVAIPGVLLSAAIGGTLVHWKVGWPG